MSFMPMDGGPKVPGVGVEASVKVPDSNDLPPGGDASKKHFHLGEKGKEIADKAEEKLAEKFGEKIEALVSDNMKGIAGEIVGAVVGFVYEQTIDFAVEGIKHRKDKKEPAPVLDEMRDYDDIAVTGSTRKNEVAKADSTRVDIAGAVKRMLGQKNFEVTIASGDKLDVRQFSIHERLSSLFQVNLVVVSDNPSIEFDDVVGQPAKFSMSAGMHDKFWSGVCNHFEQVRHEPGGLSTYQFSIVPTLWFLTQRKNHRMHQQISEPDIVLKMLKEWGIKPVEQYDRGSYKKRKYRVQYNESDFAFICRMLEDAGITFYFQQGSDETELVLSDAPQSNPPRAGSLAFKDDTSLTNAVHTEFVTGVRMGQRVRPGKYTMRDHDYRKPPTYKLLSTASKGLPMEDKLERFQYVPGAFLFGADSGDATPSADDKGKARTDEKEAVILAQKRLDAKRGSARTATFETNAHDLAPGVVLTISGHGHGALSDDKKLLVVESSLSGTASGEWSQHCEVRGTEIPFRPELVTSRPKTQGIESATVVGPPGEEIHCDEFGRVRCHFHWDRESKMDDNSSCWIHASQPWGGAGYGGSALPRIGQEVLVDFLGGDPDRPVIVGRVYTNLQKTPYKLPDNKTQSGLKSNSTGGGGGYNELMFEDAKGKELVNMQAEKDLKKLVKNDENVTIGRHRTKLVKHNDGLTVGGNRTKRVVHNEHVTIGMNQKVSVGINRSTQVGMIDSTMVGDTHVVTIAPPGEQGPGGPHTSALMKHKKFVWDTGAGARITMDGATVTIAATTIMIQAKASLLACSAGATVVGGVGALTLGSPASTTVNGGVLNLSGTSTATLTSSGPTTVSGTPVQLNGPGLFAGRVTELAPATITTGAALVLIGGASFPYPIEKLDAGNPYGMPAGTLKIGDHIFVQPGNGRYQDFQNKVVRDLGVMSSTPSGATRLANIQSNSGGHNVTIREYTAAEANDPRYGENNSLTYPGAVANSPNALRYDTNGNPVAGPGTDSLISYNPDIQIGPPGHAEPTDATLNHEMDHAEHNVYGTNRQWESMGNGWDNREEWQTIEGHTTVPGVPSSPTENEYLANRNYPFRRTDHQGGYHTAP